MSEPSQWKQLTEAAANRARAAIADAAMAGDLRRVQQITEALRPLDEALETLITARKNWSTRISLIEELTPSDHSKAPQTKLKITLDWPVAGFSRPAETIAQPKAADTFARCLASLAEAFGVDGMARLTQIRVGKAGLVSRTPTQEFINPSTGDVYGHRAIGGTGWFVHTGTSTELKADHIRQSAVSLGLPARALRIEIIPK